MRKLVFYFISQLRILFIMKREYKILFVRRGLLKFNQVLLKILCEPNKSSIKMTIEAEERVVNSKYECEHLNNTIPVDAFL